MADFETMIAVPSRHFNRLKEVENEEVQKVIGSINIKQLNSINLAQNKPGMGKESVLENLNVAFNERSEGKNQAVNENKTKAKVKPKSEIVENENLAAIDYFPSRIIPNKRKSSKVTNEDVVEKPVQLQPTTERTLPSQAALAPPPQLQSKVPVDNTMIESNRRDIENELNKIDNMETEDTETAAEVALEQEQEENEATDIDIEADSEFTDVESQPRTPEPMNIESKPKSSINKVNQWIKYNPPKVHDRKLMREMKRKLRINMEKRKAKMEQYDKHRNYSESEESEVTVIENEPLIEEIETEEEEESGSTNTPPLELDERAPIEHEGRGEIVHDAIPAIEYKPEPDKSSFSAKKRKQVDIEDTKEKKSKKEGKKKEMKKVYYKKTYKAIPTPYEEIYTKKGVKRTAKERDLEEDKFPQIRKVMTDDKRRKVRKSKPHFLTSKKPLKQAYFQPERKRKYFDEDALLPQISKNKYKPPKQKRQKQLERFVQETITAFKRKYVDEDDLFPQLSKNKYKPPKEKKKKELEQMLQKTIRDYLSKEKI